MPGFFFWGKVDIISSSHRTPHNHEYISFYGFQIAFHFFLLFLPISFGCCLGQGVNFTSQCLVTAKEIRMNHCFSPSCPWCYYFWGGGTIEPSSSVNRCSFSLEITLLLCYCIIRMIIFCFVLHEITGQCYRISTTIKSPRDFHRLFSFYEHSVSTGWSLREKNNMQLSQLFDSIYL